jgi:hypothetical protein
VSFGVELRVFQNRNVNISHFIARTISKINVSQVQTVARPLPNSFAFIAKLNQVLDIISYGIRTVITNKTIIIKEEERKIEKKSYQEPIRSTLNSFRRSISSTARITTGPSNPRAEIPSWDTSGSGGG